MTETFNVKVSMVNEILVNLKDIRLVIRGLDHQEYARKLEVLSGSSVGQHIRHILEFYDCLLQLPPNKVICYDNRKRDRTIELDRSFASRFIDKLWLRLMPLIRITNYN
jgi:hypothetical protein